MFDAKSKAGREELRAMEAAATKGPWTSSREDMDSFTDLRGITVHVVYVYREPYERIPVYETNARADARLIAASRNAILPLLAYVEEMEANQGELVTALKHMRTCGDCAEDSWDSCEGGRAALAALARAEKGSGGK